MLDINEHRLWMAVRQHAPRAGGWHERDGERPTLVAGCRWGETVVEFLADDRRTAVRTFRELGGIVEAVLLIVGPTSGPTWASDLAYATVDVLNGELVEDVRVSLSSMPMCSAWPKIWRRCPACTEQHLAPLRSVLSGVLVGRSWVCDCGMAVPSTLRLR